MSGSTMTQERTAPPPLTALIERMEASEAQRALPYDRSPGMYGLSPNALSIFRESPIKYFFRYCGPRSMKWPDFPQSAPMAVGQGMDSLAKDELIRLGWKRDRRRTFRNKELNGRSFSIFGEVKPWNRTKAVRERVRETWRGLEQTPLWEYFKSFQTVDLETDIREPRWVHGAPLNGKLDFLMRSWEPVHETGIRHGIAVVPGDFITSRIVADMKINGAFSASGSSPVPGYSMRTDYDPVTDTLYEKDGHERAGEPMELLHHQFATQLATYCLIEDAVEQGSEEPDVSGDDRVMLIQATYGKPTKKPKVRKDGTSRDWKFQNGRITFTLIDTHVTGSFKRSVLEDYRALWAAYRSRTIIPHHLAVYGESFLWMLQARPFANGRVGG